mgnify:CR=1 FL=1
MGISHAGVCALVEGIEKSVIAVLSKSMVIASVADVLLLEFLLKGMRFTFFILL